ncbi:MAG TPA: hypothetical protein VGX25_35310 [Actinophytocola sp.]|uniref:hypothetical protein n=1 Tax=Actinophytocola sp. TaxID=1872138 RepID=UPI002DDD9C0E|nr:hypothetical protein [Actinophytocola sp.]HEV2784683.1 hypothetical protein [Actinophytocola sp.]
MTNPDNPVYLVTDEHGEPLGTFDPDLITTEGTRFAFDLAAVCDDPAAMQHVQRETLARVGSATFGYVAASALGVMAEHILAPTFEVCRVYGTDLQVAMAAIARGETPA